MTTTPFWQSADDQVSLYLGDMREVLPALGVLAVTADPIVGNAV